MVMLATYLNAVRDYGQSIISHIGLVNGAGAEPSGGSPAYARKAVTWIDDGTGIMRPSANLVFDIPAGFTVSAWRGFSALTAGVDYGGADLTDEAFAGQGTYTLLATTSGITHSAA